MSTAYNHPEGGSIDLDCTTLTVTAENGHIASVEIGPDGMRDLAKKLMTHAADFEYAMHLESLSHDEVVRATRKTGTASQIDNIEMQDELGRFLSGLVIRQKSIRFSNGDTERCPDCGSPTTFLNVERDHHAVCFACGTFDHFGENLHSAWRDETPELWAANQKILDVMTHRPPPPFTPNRRDDFDSIPF